ncbi:MAG: caspase family protein [Rhizobiales bacterium]|nr:caspase family protein [Hyphomicrobiales bacterium]
MRRLGALLALFWCAIGLWIMPPGQADAADSDRVALVIGNANYQHLEKLKNPTNDARALAAKLKSVGFAVTLLENLDRRGMVWSVSDWLRLTRADQTALIYYAGHGIEVAGRNYLLPVDMPLLNMGEENLIRSEAISLDDLLADVNAAPARRGIVILDACRNNPLAHGTRSVGATRGMARVDNPFGTFVMYAAGARQTALDYSQDDGKNGLFTKTLLKHIGNSNLELRRLAITVRDEVARIAKTKFSHLQIPSYYDQMTGDFFFAKASTNQTTAIAPLPNTSKLWDVEQIRTAIEGSTFLFNGGSETIFFSSGIKNTLTEHLGAEFMQTNIRKDVVLQVPFLAKITAEDKSVQYIEGIGGIARGTKKRGSALFLLQATAADKTLKRFAKTDRVFSTLRLRGAIEQPECARSTWRSLLGFKGKLAVKRSDCVLRRGNHLAGN